MNWILFLLFLIVLLVFTILLNYIQIVRHERIEMQKDAVVGDMKYSARTCDYKGWLICDGRSMKREDYHELFQVIGTTYGSVSALTFNLPDCRGRVLGASGQGTNLTSRAMGASIGEETHTMLVSELVSHTHTGTTDTAGDHSHTGTTNVEGSHSHTHNANAYNNATNEWVGLASSNGNNTTASGLDYTLGEINTWAPPRALAINNNGSHSHTVSTASNGTHTHTFTSNATGGGQAFNVIQPTLFIGNVFIYYGFKEHDHHDDHNDHHDHDHD
jgi:microcystin-dependent protein